MSFGVLSERNQSAISDDVCDNAELAKTRQMPIMIRLRYLIIFKALYLRQQDNFHWLGIYLGLFYTPPTHCCHHMPVL